MKKIPLSEATPAELREFASVVLGLEAHQWQNREQLRALIATTGYDKDFIEIEEPKPSGPAKVVPSALDASRKTVTINIPQQHGPGGKDPVVVGVNGRVARIMRGTDVEVPEKYVEVLRNAQTVEYDKGPNGEPINPRFVPKHPFSILSGL